MSDETENRRALPGDFGSRVAHEIRGPLNLLAGALPELANADPEAREKLLEHAADVAALELVGGNKSQAARVLGLDRRTLYRRLEKYETE